jgi:hypothetical protein
MRDHHGMAYDAERGLIVVFGGSGQLASGGYPDPPTYFHDLWGFDGSRWTPIAREGPPSRGGLPGLAYDAHRRRLVLFGGGGSPGLWEWDGHKWEKRSQT